MTAEDTFKPNTVKLTSGAVYPRGHVKITYLYLKKLMEEKPKAFAELVAACRRRHQVQGEDLALLRQLNWLDINNKPHEFTRDVVQHYVVGMESDLELLEPGDLR